MYKCKKCGYTGDNFWKEELSDYECPRCHTGSIIYSEEYQKERIRKANEVLDRFKYGDDTYRGRD